MAGQTKNETVVGRPPKPAHLKRDNRIVVMMTDDEVAALDHMVQSEGFADRSDLIRALLARNSDQVKKAAGNVVRQVD